jgi:hypothetical protein
MRTRYNKLINNSERTNSASVNVVAAENSIWKKIIDIKSQLLEFQSPSLIVKNQVLSKKYVEFEIDDQDQLLFLSDLEKSFKTTIVSDDRHSYFYTDSETSSLITEEKISDLKRKAESNFIDFKGVPVIEGVITSKGLVDYQHKVLSENIGSIKSSTHEINPSDLSKVVDILEEFSERVKRISFFPVDNKLSNELIKKIRKIKKNQSQCIYSAKMSTSNILFDVTKYSLNQLKPLLFETYETLGEDNGLKIRLELNTGFDYHSIVAKLSERKIRTYWSKNKSSLIFWREYEKGKKSLEQRFLDSYINENILTPKLNLKFEQSDKEKYLLFIDEEKRNIIKNENIDNLKRLDFCYRIGKQFIDFGTLIKVNYPVVRFRLNDYFVDEKSLPDLVNIQPSLKGEKDKVKRLKHTLDNFDSSRNELLKILSSPEHPNNDFTDEDLKIKITEVKSDCLNVSLNNSQIEAVAKSTLAKSLFLIQGPPGTGKSTAISEIIWQHIINEESNDYKILVTSETNLAVDNAINKLTSKTNMLLKPIRLGSSNSVDYEGQRFLFSNLKSWGSNIAIENFNSDIILDNWVNQVVSRANGAKGDNDDLIDLWSDYLSAKGDDVRTSFYKSYLTHCNVIGSTSGSIGIKSSTNRYTPFYKAYEEVTSNSRKEFGSKRKVWGPVNGKIDLSNNPNDTIDFDLVIQDESSKSTQPELLLPCLYSTKAIIIGDHRQLPPMLNTNEFIEEFEQVLKRVEKSKHSELRDSIKFIKSHRKYFDVSFFEKLFLTLDEKSKSSFNIQYRMHPSINNTINQFYKDDNGLFCGLDKHSVDKEDLSDVSSRFLGQKLFGGAKVVWVNTESPEILVGTSRVNPTEVEIVKRIISKLSEDEGYLKFKDYWSDADEKEIGVITFYGAQKQLLQKAIPVNMNRRISVVDRFQGMERNVIICSLVRSNKIAESESAMIETYRNNVGDFSLGFAQSPNRLNVALSRAKRLLIIVGNSEHFSQKDIYKNVYKSIQEDPYGLIIDSKEFMANE